MKLNSLTALSAALAVSLALASCGKEESAKTSSLSVSPTTVSFASAGGTNNVSVTANVAWTASSSDSWVTVSPASGDASETAQKVEVKAGESSELERTAKITFKSSDGKLSTVVTVSQEAYKPTEIKDIEADAFKTETAYKYQKYRLVGIAKSLQSSGAFTLTSAKGKVSVPGLNSEEKPYGTQGGKLANVKERDTVTVVGYKTDAGLAYAYLEKVKFYTEPSADDVETVAYPFKAVFTQGAQKFIVRNEVFPSAFEAIWSNVSTGWRADAYNTSKKYAVESWLISPKVNMTGAEKPILVFDHIVNNFSNVDVAKDYTSLYVRENGGSWTQISIAFSYPDEQGTSSWTSEEIDLSAYVGKTIQFAFKYTSSESDEAGQWTIVNFELKNNEETPQGDGTDGTEDYSKRPWEW